MADQQPESRIIQNPEIMNWYIAKLVFNIVSGEGNHKPQFDEQYRLVMADDYENAFAKARELGNREEEVILRANKEKLHWKFVNVAELFQMEDLHEGMELCSNIYEADDRDQYVRTVNLQAAYVKSKFQHQLYRA